MIEERLRRLERQIRTLRVYGAVLTCIAALLTLAAFQAGPDPAGVLRARGLIIEDAAGRERILIGAPIPAARNRVRTDTARVARIWGPRFPKEYLEYYKAYRHDMNGLLVLDSAGFDRLAVGENVPDPNIGRRIAPSTGIAINDSLGFERSGYGILTVDGKDRVVLGLDNAGGEAVVLFVDDRGRAGFTARDNGRMIYLGAAAADDQLTGTDEPFFGFLLRDGPRIVHRVAVDSVP
jgi:hypothetical protein